MSELLGLPQTSSVSGIPTLKDAPSATGMHPKLVKADFHGSVMTGTSASFIGNDSKPMPFLDCMQLNRVNVHP
jgi:hypothetical protein